jgi:hypothetical protein
LILPREGSGVRPTGTKSCILEQRRPAWKADVTCIDAGTSPPDHRRHMYIVYAWKTHGVLRISTMQSSRVDLAQTERFTAFTCHCDIGARVQSSSMGI